ncbi:MAG TPA: type I DNA topoisomerase [Candidatus Kapabacteria bacterium]|nr:type I DNA topoisomerase [Candidatus Kapabacteria bacterium]
MAKSLVIVESPAKAKTINKYLGADYIVDASVGHVKDLPKNGLSIDIEAGFVPTYETIRGKEDVLARLRGLASRCDRVFLATDPDREGEAIASHIAEEIGDRNRNIRRVVFNEITRTGVTNAMRSPRDIDRPMVEAQEARRVMDRLIGYKVSPFLWNTFRGESKGLSAGRVQSVALRLIVERERAINSFVPIEYWTLAGHFRTARGDEFVARLVRYDGIDVKNPSGSASELDPALPRTFISERADAEAIRERALRESYAITGVARKEVKRNAPAPFTTSTLQQDAGRRLKMATKRAMQVAQKLYEGVDLGPRGRVGLITYMRTDSVRVSDEAAQMAEEFIYENYGKEYLPPGRKTFAQKGKNVQDAHEAIRPTDLKITPREARKHLDADMAALYELIWNRFVASQMAPALIDQTTVDIEGGPFAFRTTGRITRFRGWMQVYGDDEPSSGSEAGPDGKPDAKVRKSRSKVTGDDDDEWENAERVLPDYLRKGDSLSLEKIDVKQSATKPPPRYTEALLVKELEAKGIGRPSTYASIISTIQDRGYVEQRERKLHATELGTRVCDALVEGFPALFDVRFTARMEGELDQIASGKSTYRKVLEGFYAPFEKSLRALRLPAYSGGNSSGRGVGPGRSTTAVGSASAGEAKSPRARPASRARSAKAIEGMQTDEKCVKCGSPMDLRNGRYGPYLACTAFPRCRNIVSVPGGSAQLDAASGASTTDATKSGTKRKSSKNGDVSKATARGTTTRSADEAAGAHSGKAGATAASVAEPCRDCGSPMILRRSKTGEFYGCSNYPTCRSTRPVPLGMKCPQCGEGDLAQRKGGRYDSVFYGCTRYPDCRFTSSQKPVPGTCTRCQNTWLVEIDSPIDGRFVECPKCRAKG